MKNDSVFDLFLPKKNAAIRQRKRRKMERNTIFYEALETAGLKAQYDGHVKKLLSFRQVISQILTKTLMEYEGYTPQEAAQWIAPEGILGPEEKERRSEAEEDFMVGKSEVSEEPGEGSTIYDLRFQIQTPEPEGRRSELLVNLEAQKEFWMQYRIVTRGIFYEAKMLTEQYGRYFSHSSYQKLRKVYSIWICMNSPNYVGNAMAEYKISKNDRIGSVPEEEKSYDKLSVILICLNTKKGLGEEGSLHHFLNVLLSPVLKPEEKVEIFSQVYGIRMEKEIRKELEGMCNLSEAIEEKALRRGRKEGRREGKMEGRAESLVKSVESAMKSFHVDLRTACEGLGFTLKEYYRAAELLKK